ncbi:MAG: beta-galactosidase [Candidatus Sumerlaeota bacterium]|nr:beta-galactosidase [Candidatus Sumerlaeota bacterium]
MMRIARCRSILVLAFLCAAATVPAASRGKAKGAAADAPRQAAPKDKSNEEENAPVVTLELPPPPEHPAFYPNPGLYDLEGKSDLSYIRGDQIGVQWAECEPEEGKYDFSCITRALDEAARKGRVVVIKVNGNKKPPYLYAKVPCNPAKWSVQINDKQGTLMYWHDNFKRAYLTFLAAYAAYLKTAPHKEIITALRLNYDAIGTEHYQVPDQYRPLEQWVCPPGVEQGPEYSDELKDKFKEAVVDAFVQHFLPDFKVLVRCNIEDFVVRKHADLFATGKLGWFHTGASMEENQAFHQEFRYSRFVQYCRPGYTFGFTESCGYSKFATATKYPINQWAYWRMLSELNAGVSFIGVFSANLNLARTDPYVDAGFRFAATYAGYHDQPATSPGAWVALRGKGDFFPGDYTLLMRRQPDDASSEVSQVGPAEQPYGSWARSLPAGQGMYFDLDDKFFPAGAAGKIAASIRVVYLDSGHSSWEARYDAAENPEKPACAATNTDSGQWKEISVDVTNGVFANHGPHNSDLSIFNKGPEDVVFHMIELLRTTPK